MGRVTYIVIILSADTCTPVCGIRINVIVSMVRDPVDCYNVVLCFLVRLLVKSRS